MKYLENYNQFKNNFEELNEKWYHNILAGLMMLAPSVVSAQNLNTDKANIHMASQEDSIEDIKDITQYIKSHPDEYKNSEQVVQQIENLLRKYEDGQIDSNSITKVAKEFAEKSKEMKNPKVGVKTVKPNDKHSHTSSWTKLHEITKLDTVLIDEIPREVILNIFEEGRFESGSYKINTDLGKSINDTLDFFYSKGYKIEYVVVESSTDGQQLSNKTKQSLIDEGYDASNEGLSEIRNDKLVEYIKSSTKIGNKFDITQDIHFSDDGEIDDDLRYNKVIIKVTKTEETEPKVKVTEKTVEVYYKITDYDKKKVEKGSKKAKHHKTKGGGGIVKGGSVDKCFIFSK